MIHDSFGNLLSRFRSRKGFSQKDIANKELDLSPSYISLLERGERGLSPEHPKRKPLSRQQVWYLAMKLNLWPPDCDIFLEAAGQSKDRSKKEELDIQREFKLKELWVFARHILDPDPGWFDVISQNILEEKVAYRYFTVKDTYFRILLNKLKEKANDAQKKELDSLLECILLPEELFITNFAIYNPGMPEMYCCGTKPEHGKAESFYTMHSSEATRLYQLLLGIRESLSARVDILLKDAQRIYPDGAKSHSKFYS